MKRKLKQFFQLILILYFSNSWEIEATYNGAKSEYSPIKLRIQNVTKKNNFNRLLHTIQERSEYVKDGVYVKELINNELILKNL